jgi:HK97 family phage prohead protease
MLTQDFTLRLKALDDAGTFTGYASTYGGPPDLVGDVIEPGAFAQSIASQGKGYPLLWAHRSDEPIGIVKVSDDPKGLLVNGSLLLADPQAARAHTHMKAGTVRGMSIGYDIPRGQGKVSYSDDGTRTIREIKLYEISLVAIPANPKAQVTSVKTLNDVEHCLRSITDASDAEVVRQLKSIDAQLKRLLSRKDSLCECDCPECVADNCADCSNSDCVDENCDANFADVEELAALKQLATSLKSLAQ